MLRFSAWDISVVHWIGSTPFWHGKNETLNYFFWILQINNPSYEMVENIFLHSHRNEFRRAQILTLQYKIK